MTELEYIKWELAEKQKYILSLEKALAARQLALEYVVRTHVVDDDAYDPEAATDVRVRGILTMIKKENPWLKD